MKKKIINMCLLLLSTGFLHAGTADSTGLPGDHFDLYAMLDVFKASQNPEDFEKRLNTESTHVNNLDLNQDGKVDYVRVVDNTKGKSHALVLQVAVNEKESQDVAVIEIEQKGDNDAQLQVIGDEVLYGKDYIIEPGGKRDSTLQDKRLKGFNEQTFVYVNVWYWPCVTYVYYPYYVVWVSPWYWMYWPAWWYPWHPYMWMVYYEWVYPCHSHYYYVNEYRMHEAHEVYQPRRVVSGSVEQRTAPVRQRVEQQKNTPAKNEPAQPRQQNGNEPVSKPKPTEQPAPAPNPKPQPQPAPQPKPTPSPVPSPKPVPAPKPVPQPAPTPKPRPK